MGLLHNFASNANNYLRTLNQHGDVVYTKIPSNHMIDRRRDASSTNTSELKNQLNSVNEMIKKVSQGITSPNRSFDTHGEAKARVKDSRNLIQERQKIIKQLAMQGVHVVPESLYGSKIVYKENTSINEGGNSVMNTYTDKDIDNMRLSIYEAANAGEISENLKNYLLLTVESTVEDYNNYILDQNEKELWVEEAKDNYKKAKIFLYESFDEGKITEDQLYSMIESLGEESDYVSKEVNSKELEKKMNAANSDNTGISDTVAEESGKEYIRELAALYLEACRDNNLEAKERIKEKIIYLQEKMDGDVEKAKEHSKISVVKKKLKEAKDNLDDIDRDKLRIMQKRVSGGKDDSDDLKDEEPISESEDLVPTVEFTGSVSNEALEDFSNEVYASEAFNELSEEEKDRMQKFFESVNN